MTRLQAGGRTARRRAGDRTLLSGRLRGRCSHGRRTTPRGQLVAVCRTPLRLGQPRYRSESRNPQLLSGSRCRTRASPLAIQSVKALEGPAERSVRRAPRLRGLRVSCCCSWERQFHAEGRGGAENCSRRRDPCAVAERTLGLLMESGAARVHDARPGEHVPKPSPARTRTDQESPHGAPPSALHSPYTFRPARPRSSPASSHSARRRARCCTGAAARSSST